MTNKAQSWHFVSHGEMWVPMQGDAACVWLSDTNEQVNLLVVESGENAALCLLAQPCVVIAGRAMQLGDAIKIMNDITAQPPARPFFAGTIFTDYRKAS